ncbi:MAG: class I SAM-dependent methyltransferase [Acidimicrobiia bacterium]
MADDGIQERPAYLASTFDRAGVAYDGRPGYPDAVFEILTTRCGLGAGSRVLEIGPGTGQATMPMLDRGASVVAIEPGEELARLVRERTVGRPVDVVVGRFETAVLPDERFDLVVAATSFHWVDPDVGIRRAAEHLRPGGHLALWWALWGDPDREDPFEDALEPILRQKAPHLVAPHSDLRVYLADLAARGARIEPTGWFEPVEEDTIRWEGSQSPAELRAMFATFAAWIALDEPLRTELLDDVERLARDGFGGRVTRPYRLVLFRARRRDR